MKYLLTILTTLPLILGCDSNVTPLATGNLKGGIRLFDSRCRPLSDWSGVLVKAEGTEFSALSDSNGAWTISSFPIGTYVLSFSKSGFGTKKNTKFTMIGDTTLHYPYLVDLVQPLEYTVVLDSITPPEVSPKKSGYLSGHLVGAYPEDRGKLWPLIFYGTTPNIIPWDSSTYLGALNFAYSLELKDSILYFEASEWENYGPLRYRAATWVESGKKIYLQAFPWCVDYDMQYYDSVAGTWVNSLPYNGSKIYSVKVP